MSLGGALRTQHIIYRRVVASIPVATGNIQSDAGDFVCHQAVAPKAAGKFRGAHELAPVMGAAGDPA